MEFALAVDTEDEADIDYDAEIIKLRKKSIRKVEKRIADMRRQAEEECDDLALQQQRREDALTASTHHNIEKLAVKKDDDLKALQARLDRQRAILQEQEEIFEESPDEDIEVIIAGLRKNVGNIEKSIAGRDSKLENDSDELLEQLKTDLAEMESLTNNQCMEVRSGAEEALAPVKALLRLQKHQLMTEEMSVADATAAGLPVTDNSSSFDQQLRLQSLQIHSPVKMDERIVNHENTSQSSPVKRVSPSKRSSPTKTKPHSSTSSPISQPVALLTPTKSCKKTGYSPSLEAAKRTLLNEEDVSEDDRSARDAMLFQKAVDIVHRYQLRGNVLPRPRSLKLPSSAATTASSFTSSSTMDSGESDADRENDNNERDQEYKDFINLDRWKQSLRSDGKESNGLKWFGFCPDEVRDFLDAEMPTWRDSRWSVDMGKSVHD
mmetsp:Transcript_19928/g.33593  ORF Transcript_19928/g.33593 Transcript_19928/m.33593 type:complete len:436 (-) Transcript_19928:296-1603(-)